MMPSNDSPAGGTRRRKPMPREHALHTHDEAAATRAKSEIAAHPTTGCSGGGGGSGSLAVDVEAKKLGTVVLRS